MTKSDLDTIFLGGLFPAETEDEIFVSSIGPIDNAANNLQWKLVQGLDANLESSVRILNSLYIGSYPSRYKLCRLKSYAFSHCDGAEDFNVGFCNLSGVKHLSRYLSLKPHLNKWALDGGLRPKVIVAYALTSVFVELLTYVKRLNPLIVTIMVVPDLPQYMNTSTRQPLLLRGVKAASIHHISKRLKEVDGFVLLTRYMTGALGIEGKPCSIVEGIADAALEYADNSVSEASIDIVYTGTLNTRYGILSLVDAFMGIKHPNWRLVLCGAGDSLLQIEEAMRRDSRIVYMGQVKKEEIVAVQKRATVLVNPRQDNEEFVKYSFPSKIMEYMSSGKPVICYKLPGIPEEYDKYLHYVDGSSVEALREKLVEVCQQPAQVRRAFGASAREWVLSHKNSERQCGKIIDLVTRIRVCHAAR